MRTHRRWFAAAALALLAASCREQSAPQLTQIGTYPQAPVIVISIDTLRADHLPAYGYQQVETPAIDALRRDAILFQNAYSHVPLTLPSHAALLTGKLPNENGVRDNIGYSLAETANSLPLLLKAQGYETGAAVSAYVLRGETGLRAMFDAYDDGISFQPGASAGSIQRPGAKTVDGALQWITPRAAKPFFFMLHLFEPHTPYEPPEPFRSKFASAYDGEIAYADSLVGRFVDELKRTGVYDRAVIILLSDHGEGLSDHGEREHGIFVYREAIHVPLLVKLPKNASAGSTVARPVGLIDVLPTVASLTGVTVPSGLRGVSLTANVAADAPPRRVYAESMYGRLHLGWSELRSLVSAQHQFIEAPKPELYDLAADPGQKNNILADERRTFAAFRDELAQYPRELQKPANVSAEEQAKLAALGYLGSSSAAASGPPLDPKDHIGELTAYEDANALVQRGEYDRAIAMLRDVLAKNPRFVDARMQLAGAYEATGRYAEAETAYRSLLEDNPALIEQVAIALGAVYMNLGKYDDAAKHADLAVRSNPGGARLLLGRIALARGDFAGAESQARQAMQDAHYRGSAALLGAEALLRQRQLPRALALLDDAKRGAGSPVRGLELLRGDTLMRMQRVQEAEVAIRDEIRTFPDNRDAYATLAGILLLQNRGADAEAVLQALVAANPSPSSYALAARTLEALGQPAAAAVWRRRGAGAR